MLLSNYVDANSMGKKIITILLGILICFRIGWLGYQQKDKYAPNYWSRYETFKSVYGESQYSMKGWKYWIPDETVYAYAGGAYIKGANPIIVESTQPPLGKYLIGLSILATGNEHSTVAVFFVLLLIGIYFLVRMIDIFFITFVLYAIIAASHAIQKSKPVFILLSFLFLGLSMMTKVWLIGAVFAIVITLYIFIKRPKYYVYILVGGLIVLITTLLTYVRMFTDGYTVIEVLKVQKWLFWYQNGKINHIFTIWPLIFMNRWYVWWGEVPVITDLNWSVSWPIVIGSGIASSVYGLRTIIKKTEPAIHISALSIFAYAVFISLGQASARYLLPFLPICYSMMIWAAYDICKRFFVKRSHRI